MCGKGPNALLLVVASRNLSPTTNFSILMNRISVENLGSPNFSKFPKDQSVKTEPWNTSKKFAKITHTSKKKESPYPCLRPYSKKKHRIGSFGAVYRAHGTPHRPSKTAPGYLKNHGGAAVET
jgi:hypothetical protein